MLIHNLASSQEDAAVVCCTENSPELAGLNLVQEQGSKIQCKAAASAFQVPLGRRQQLRDEQKGSLLWLISMMLVIIRHR